MGVFLSYTCIIMTSISLPHVRGGVSEVVRELLKVRPSSPRAWGCFSMIPIPVLFLSVFPTCVGVFPICTDTITGVGLSSPRAWGCFCFFLYTVNSFFVFPTCVGVFPNAVPALRTERRLPHVRGGVSASSGRKRTQKGSSPRAWGCFLRCGVHLPF